VGVTLGVLLKDNVGVMLAVLLNEVDAPTESVAVGLGVSDGVGEQVAALVAVPGGHEEGQSQANGRTEFVGQ
jgi:hypothetical protein